jgi:uncharacterized protein
MQALGHSSGAKKCAGRRARDARTTCIEFQRTTWTRDGGDFTMKARSIHVADVAVGAAACVAASLALAQPSPSTTPVAPPGVHVKLLSQHDGVQSYQLVFDAGTEVMSTLSALVIRNGFGGAHFEGLGACTDALVGYYDPNIRNYRKTTYSQQMEIVSIIGDAAPTNGEAGLHIHIGLGFADGTMHGGHLLEAHVSPTLEMLLTVSPVPIHRKHDPTFDVELLVP